MTNDELLSKTIIHLRFPLTVGIVFIHFSLHDGLTIHGIKHGLENPEWFFFIVNLISETLARIGVPLFFIFSGFLFFYRKDFNRNVYIQKLKSRTKTLLIPFILWNIIAIVWNLKCFLPGISSFYRSVEIHISLIRLFNTFFCNVDNNGIFVGPPTSDSARGFYPIDVPLWYIRDLMVMIILSPLIHKLIKKIGGWFVVMGALMWFFSPLILPKGGYLGIYTNLLVTALFFFSWGALFSITKGNIVISFRKWKYAPPIYVCIAIADALTKGMEYNGYIHKAGILGGVISTVVIVSTILNSKKVRSNNTLANSSFFIFALHYLFIEDVGKFAFTMLHVPENNPYAMLALYFSVPIFSILVCLCLYASIKKIMPKVCHLLTGGR